MYYKSIIELKEAFISKLFSAISSFLLRKGGHFLFRFCPPFFFLFLKLRLQFYKAISLFRGIEHEPEPKIKPEPIQLTFKQKRKLSKLKEEFALRKNWRLLSCCLCSRFAAHRVTLFKVLGENKYVCNFCKKA